MSNIDFQNGFIVGLTLAGKNGLAFTNKVDSADEVFAALFPNSMHAHAADIETDFITVVLGISYFVDAPSAVTIQQTWTYSNYLNT